MPLPLTATNAADAYARLRAQATQMHGLAAQLQAQVSAGTVYPEFLLDVLATAAATIAETQGHMRTPGVDAYAQAAMGTAPVAATADLAAGSATIQNIPSGSGLVIGMTVSCAGLPAGTTVQAVPSATSATLSQAATATVAGAPLSAHFDIKTQVSAALDALGALRAAILAEYPRDATTGVLQDRTFAADGTVAWARPRASSFPQTASAVAGFLAAVV